MFSFEEANRRRLLVTDPARVPRDSTLDQFLDWLGASLLENSDTSTMGASLEIAYLLNEFRSDERIWKWIEEKARMAGPKVQNAFKIAFLEQLPKPPRELLDIERLWRFSISPETRWAIKAAYGNDAKAIRKDYRLVNQFRLKHHLKPLPTWNIPRFEASEASPQTDEI